MEEYDHSKGRQFKKIIRNSNQGTTQLSFSEWQIIHQNKRKKRCKIMKKKQVRAETLDNSYTVQFFAEFFNKEFGGSCVTCALCTDDILRLGVEPVFL